MVIDEREVFGAALALTDANEREAYLQEACAGHPELLGRLRELLAAHDESQGPLDRGPAALAVTLDAPTTEVPGTFIGPYKLLQQIGEGGMGVVWMAEQTQPVQRKVAIKVIKPGMDSRQVIARFEQERQALAMMDHVNIARVLDAGTVGQAFQPDSSAPGQAGKPDLQLGRPYFVMELVHGVPITKYCDDNHLTPRQRLELFVPVCQAIQHAHQKGIIHRDIKPSNVMVTLYEGKPVPKVIDFGVAKATEQKLTERTLFTQYGTMVGTLEYMSPEQAEMSALGIDTRSDIYSLGVLLYELLTGTTPLTHRRMKEAAYAEILRMIKEEEPPRPSTRLSDSGEALASISAQRHMEPAKLTKLVRGELDWIVMRTLEKDRNRRYETAKDFAADVQRYLSDETVQACPPSAGYRFRKFARRNRSGLAVAGLVLFFLVLLGSGAGWTWRDRAARAREAELERVRATEQANHLERAVERAELLQREGRRGEALAALERVQLLAHEAEPASPLAKRIESLQQRLDDEGRDEVFVAQFEAIRREVQTEVDVEKGHFSREKAIPKMREALKQYGIAVGVTPPAAVVTHIQKRPRAIQAVVVAALDELSFVPREDSATRAWLFDVLQKADSDPWRNKVRAWKQPGTLDALAKDIDVRQQPPSFLLLVANTLPIESPSRLDLARRVQFAYPGDFWANHDLGLLLAHVGKDAEAIRYYTAALALRPDNPGVLINRAHPLWRVGELEAAIADLQRAIALAPRYASAHNNLGFVLFRQKKVDQAIACFEKAVEIDPNHGGAHHNLADALMEQEKLDAAVAEYREAIRLEKDDATHHYRLGLAMQKMGQPDDAITEYREAIRHKADFPEAHYDLGNVLRKKGQMDAAITEYRQAIRLKPDYVEAYLNLGNALERKGQLGAAIAEFREAIRIKADYAEAHVNLGNALANKGQLDAAIAEYWEAIRIKKDLPQAHNGLGKSLARKGKVDDAIAAFKEGIRLNPQSALAHNYFGAYLCDELKDYDKAIECFRKAIELDPKFADAYDNLGIAIGKKGWDLINSADPKRRDPKRAIEVVRVATELVPQSVSGWQYLGWIEYRAGNWKASIEALDKSCKLQDGGTGDAGQWIVLALAHAKLAAQEGLPEKEREHHKADARTWYDKAVEWMGKNDPKNEELRRFRAEAEELMKFERKND